MRILTSDEEKGRTSVPLEEGHPYSMKFPTERKSSFILAKDSHSRPSILKLMSRRSLVQLTTNTVTEDIVENAQVSDAVLPEIPSVDGQTATSVSSIRQILFKVDNNAILATAPLPNLEKAFLAAESAHLYSVTPNMDWNEGVLIRSSRKP